MKNLSKTFLLIIPVLFFVSCVNTPNVEIPIISIEDIENVGEININNWVMMGAFKLDSIIGDSPKLKYDPLKHLGHKEDSLTVENLPLLFSRIQSSQSLGVHNDLKVENLSYEDNYVQLGAKFKIKNSEEDYTNSTIYLSTVIYSTTPKTVYLLSTGGNQRQIIVNNSVVFSEEKNHSGSSQFEDFIELPLDSGKNLIVYKMFTSKKKLPFLKVSLTTERKCFEYLHERYSNLIIRHHILLDVDTLEVIPKMHQLAKGSLFEISKIRDGVEVVKTLNDDYGSIDLEDLEKNTIYSISSTIKGFNYQQYIFYGDSVGFNKYADELLRIELREELDEDFLLGIEALKYRLSELLSSKHYNMKNGWWKQKIMLLLARLEYFKSNVEIIKRPLTLPSGINFMGFVSKLDDQVQHYMVAAPDKAGLEEKSLPVIFVLRPQMENHHHFLLGPQIAKQWSLNKLAYYAKKYKCLIVLSGGRTYRKETLNPIGERDFFEVINNLEDFYDIDHQRINLLGTCSAGIKALKLGIRYPDVFSSIGVFGLGSSMNELGLKNLANTPIYIQHDYFDDHSSAKSSIEFAKAAKDLGLNYIFDLDTYSSRLYLSELVPERSIEYFKNVKPKNIPKHIRIISNQLKYGKSHWLKVTGMNDRNTFDISAKYDSIKQEVLVSSNGVKSFEIDLSQIPNYDSSKRIIVLEGYDTLYSSIANIEDIEINFEVKGSSKILEKNNEIEGPINHLFFDNFQVISANRENAVIADKFLTTYNEYFYTQKERLSKISESNIADSHLIIFGYESEEKQLSELLNSLPLEVDENKISLAGKDFLGRRLNACFIYPNPLNANKYVLVIISRSTYDLQEFKPWVNGEFDYKIWNYGRILSKGYFNQGWLID